LVVLAGVKTLRTHFADKINHYASYFIFIQVAIFGIALGTLVGWPFFVVLG